VPISAGDQIHTSPALNLINGDTVAVEDLFISMLVGSENDAAMALANHTEREMRAKFVSIMNDEAKQLRMDSTNFSNSLGFDSVNNFSTAADLRKLVDATQELSAFSLYNRQLGHSFKGALGSTYSSKATNRLISRDPEIFAIKTGYTDGAGGSMIVKAVRDEHSVVIIVLGSADREGDTKQLKDAIFLSYKWQ
jgi:D-alanyl-D-alanine carboxypeptidase